MKFSILNALYNSQGSLTTIHNYVKYPYYSVVSLHSRKRLKKKGGGWGGYSLAKYLLHGFINKLNIIIQIQIPTENMVQL